MQQEIKITEQLLKSLDLKNGLTLQLWARSKVMAGNRWKISITAQADIPVEKAFQEINAVAPVPVDEIKKLLGEYIRFEKKMERFFIDENEKDHIIRAVADSLIESILPYLNHPRFCKNFVVREFMKAQQAESLRKRG